jgi:cell wall-associated NlpC family hydrolase
MYKKCKGGASIYVLLILTGIIGISYLINNGVIPIFTADNKVRKVVSKVSQPPTKEEDGLQLKSIGYDPASVTVMPTASYLATLPATSPTQQPNVSGTPASGSPAPTQVSQLTPTRPPTSVTPGASVTPPRNTPTATPKPTPTPSGSTALTSMQTRLLAIARSQKGDKYGWGDCHNWSSSGYRPSSTPKKSDGCNTYDCSGFTGWAYYWATNGKFNMRGQTCRDYGNCYTIDGGFRTENPSLYTKFSYKELSKIKFGDLVYFGTNRDKKYPTTSHVALYVGAYGSCGGKKDCIIDASGSGGWQVSERSLSTVPKSIIGFLRPKI